MVFRNFETYITEIKYLGTPLIMMQVRRKNEILKFPGNITKHLWINMLYTSKITWTSKARRALLSKMEYLKSTYGACKNENRCDAKRPVIPG